MTQAIDALSSYLTSSPTAPLNKEFVEIELPSLVRPVGSYMEGVLTGCSTYIYDWSGTQSDTLRFNDIRRFRSD